MGLQGRGGGGGATPDDGSVTLAKLADLATDRLIGRDTAGTGVPEALTVDGGLEFSGAGGIQRSALTGDVTASAGSGTTAIANNAVTPAKLDDGFALSVLGRSANSAGDRADIATSASSSHVLRENGAGALSWGTIGALSIGDGAVVFSKLQDLATQTLMGRNSGGTGDPEQVNIGQLLLWLLTTRGDLLRIGAGPTPERLALGTAGQVLRSDGTDAAWGTRFPKGHIDGLRVRYSSVSAVVVETGQARDDADAADMTLAAETTVSITTLGAAAGLDRAMASATATTHGTATFEPSASIYAETALSSTVRSGTGTITGAGTTITGTSTRFLTELAVGDVIRSTSTGATRVTAIASDTSLTVVAAFPGGSPAGSGFTVYENLIVWPDTATAGDERRVNTITHAGTSVVVSSALASNGAGKTMAIGSELASAWHYVWLVSGASGTTCILSTQRTTPYGVTGYTTSKRRIGAVYNNSSGDIDRFVNRNYGRVSEWYTTETANFTGGTATSFTSFAFSDAAVSPIATAALFSVAIVCPSTGANDAFEVVHLSSDGTNIHSVHTQGNVDNAEHGATGSQTMWLPCAFSGRLAWYKRLALVVGSTIDSYSFGWRFER